MKNQLYEKELGATAAYTIRAGEGTTQDKESVMVLMGDAQFGLVRVVAAAAAKRNIDTVY